MTTSRREQAAVERRHRQLMIACSFAVFTVLAALQGCRRLTAPDIPDNAVPFQPPVAYASWWGDTERCSRIGGAVEGVQWYTIPSAAHFTVNGIALSGLWIPDGNTIVLAEMSTDSAMSVRHEMLHSLLQRGDHPPEYFQRRCRGVVTCRITCVTDSLATI
jgi:hypothetical protein